MAGLDCENVSPYQDGCHLLSNGSAKTSFYQGFQDRAAQATNNFRSLVDRISLERGRK